tara:strand:+ start:110 stop:577 length:468 start_codon:yes stop_codon:yes gene_type:complete
MTGTTLYVIIAITIVLFIVIYFLIDNVFERLINSIFSLFRVNAGEAASLSIDAETQDDRVILSVKNEGEYVVKLAAVEGLNRDRRKYYPIPYTNEEELNSVPEEKVRKQFSNKSINPQQTIKVILDRSEIDYKASQKLSILDANGKAWSVSGFNS